MTSNEVISLLEYSRTCITEYCSSRNKIICKSRFMLLHTHTYYIVGVFLEC